MAKLQVMRFVVGPVGTNCYFAINTETKEALVVDPGASGAKLAKMLQEEGLLPKAILLTHGHFDHAGGIGELKAAWEKIAEHAAAPKHTENAGDAVSSGATLPVYTCGKEKDTLKNPAVNLSAGMFGNPETYDADIFLNDGDEADLAGFTVRLLHTPGHTEGGCCFYLPEEGALFSGDTLFCGSVGRTDFPGGSMSVLVRSIQEKLFTLPEETRVYPGHDAETVIGDEKRYNPFI